MTKPSVYLDATIPSFQFEDRPGTIIQAWHEITQRFWQSALPLYDVYVSDETHRELEEPHYPAEKRKKCLELIATLPRLATTQDVIDLATYYVAEGLMPQKDPGDAYHLAFATWYEVKYLLTWNCKHLANANKFEHIQTLNERRSLKSPIIATPEQLLEIFP